MAVALSLMNSAAHIIIMHAQAARSCCVRDAVLLCAERRVTSAAALSKKSFYAVYISAGPKASDALTQHHTQHQVWWSLYVVLAVGLKPSQTARWLICMLISFLE
jgi:hypothetical protein